MKEFFNPFTKTIAEVAFRLYHANEFSVIPLPKRSKHGSLDWKPYQERIATNEEIEGWIKTKQLGNIAVICGKVSGNLVVIDLDGLEAVKAFYARFPQYLNEQKTLTIVTGSGKGEHLYFYVRDMPENLRVSNDAGNFEIRGNGCYVVAPPSVHPSGGLYKVKEGYGGEIARVENLMEICLWFNSMKKKADRALSPSPSPQQDLSKYAQTALNNEVQEVRLARQGNRNNTLNTASYKLGQLVASNLLLETTVRKELSDAADSVGLTQLEAMATINSGLEAGMKKPYTPTPNGNGNHAPEGESSEKAPEITPTEFGSSKPTDDDIGDKIIEQLDGRYRFFYGAWHKYDKGLWSIDPQFKLIIWEQLKKLKRERYGIRPTDSKVTSIEKYLQMYLMIDDEKINQGANFINLKNGIYNLKESRLDPHDRELYMTSQLPFDYDPKAKSPQFQAFLNKAFVHPDLTTDETLIAFVQEALGYSLTSSTDLRASFWLVGESGSGKSVLVNVLSALAGDSHTTIDLDQLNNNPYQFADIAGKRIVTFTEPSARSILADNHYKRLVSQDTIMARQIFGKPFRFTPICKVWGAMNATPGVADRSGAVFDRVFIIPMTYVVPRHLRDTQLTRKLEGELAGIFNFALEGLARLRRNRNFTSCKQIEDARKEYQSENDVEAQFIESWCIAKKETRIGGQQLYDAYVLWCKKNGASPKASFRVTRDWERLGYPRLRSHGRTFYMGLELNEIGLEYIRI